MPKKPVAPANWSSPSETLQNIKSLSTTSRDKKTAEEDSLPEKRKRKGEPAVKNVDKRPKQERCIKQLSEQGSVTQKQPSTDLTNAMTSIRQTALDGSVDRHYSNVLEDSQASLLHNEERALLDGSLQTVPDTCSEPEHISNLRIMGTEVNCVLLPVRDPLVERKLLTIEDARVKDAEARPQFSVMSYNILAECHRVRCDYTYAQEDYLCIDYRHKRIMREVEEFGSDIICMQEVGVSYYDDILCPAMSRLGYEGEFCRRVGVYPEGEAIFHRTSQFTKLSSEQLSYSAMADQDIEVLELDKDTKYSIREHIKKEAVLQITRLYHKNSSRPISIGNTHLSWTHFKDVDVNCLQIGYAFRRMVSCSDNGASPFLLVGDFNTRPWDPAYQLAKDGYLNDNSINQLQSLRSICLPDGTRKSLVDILWHVFQHPARHVASAYVKVQGAEPQVTSRTSFMADCVDYIWACQLQPIDVLEVNETPKLPTAVYPSDHLSLLASFTF